MVEEFCCNAGIKLYFTLLYALVSNGVAERYLQELEMCERVLPFESKLSEESGQRLCTIAIGCMKGCLQEGLQVIFLFWNGSEIQGCPLQRFQSMDKICLLSYIGQQKRPIGNCQHLFSTVSSLVWRVKRHYLAYMYSRKIR